MKPDTELPAKCLNAWQSYDVYTNMVNPIVSTYLISEFLQTSTTIYLPIYVWINVFSFFFLFKSLVSHFLLLLDPKLVMDYICLQTKCLYMTISDHFPFFSVILSCHARFFFCMDFTLYFFSVVAVIILCRLFFVFFFKEFFLSLSTIIFPHSMILLMMFEWIRARSIL